MHWDRTDADRKDIEDRAGYKQGTRTSRTPVVVLSTILGRTPSIEEYIAAVEGINLTSYAPPVAA